MTVVVILSTQIKVRVRSLDANVRMRGRLARGKRSGNSMDPGRHPGIGLNPQLLGCRVAASVGRDACWRRGHGCPVFRGDVGTLRVLCLGADGGGSDHLPSTGKRCWSTVLPSAVAGP